MDERKCFARLTRALFEYQPKETKIESSDGGSHHQSPMKQGRATDDILVQCF